MITLHARGWNVRKKGNLHKYLSTRYLKVSKKIKISSMKVKFKLSTDCIYLVSNTFSIAKGL